APAGVQRRPRDHPASWWKGRGAGDLRLSPGGAPARRCDQVIYRIFAVLTVIAVIVASVLLSRQQGATPTATTVRGNAWDEGYSAQNAKLVETGTDGLPLYTLNAATIRQLPNEDQV